VPEGDTIFRAARTLQRAIGGQTVTRFETVLPKLARVDFDSGMVGRAVEKVEAQGKWMLMHFSGDLILLTHMLMSGSWHIYRPGEKWEVSAHNMRIAISTEKMVAVAFNVQTAEFHTESSLGRRRGFSTLGPSVLAEDFNEAEAVGKLMQRPELEVGVALLTQSIVAGIGNVFKSEVCFACGVHPFRLVKSLAPEEATGLMAKAKEYLRANVTGTSGDRIVTYTGFRRTTHRADPSERLWVYHRRGEPCRKCGTPIESYKQGLDARTSFWCPVCQKSAAASAAR
jgi:endonuclease VIII